MTTIAVARLLGLAVRSVQMMVDRGELEAWKTPGGHRRISRASVERWQRGERSVSGAGTPATPAVRAPTSAEAVQAPQPGTGMGSAKVMLIEDSMHFQNLIRLLLRQQFPDIELLTASDGIAGLAMVGQFQPDILLVDLLLPGIDGAALIASLRSQPLFRMMQVIVVTSLETADQTPYAFALQGLPVVHKPRLVPDLPPLLTRCLERRAAGQKAP
jgi:excisionase family DNA binding protein